MTLWIEPGREVREGTCPDCGGPCQRVTGFVHRDDDAYAVYFASCYHHGGHEVWMDAIFGTWGDDKADDRVTFGCRVGPVPGQSEPAASLVTAAEVAPSASAFGQRLTRDEALRHPRLTEFWQLVDHVLVNDPTVAAHLYGATPDSSS